MDAIDREWFARLAVQVQRRVEEIDERDACFLRGLFRCPCVCREPGVVGRAVGQVGVARILEGDGAEQHDPWEFAVRLRAAGLLDELQQLLFVLVRLAGERLVVPEECEHDSRLHLLQVRRHRHLPRTTRIIVRAVAADAHATEPHLLTDELALQDCLHPAIVLHTIC